MRIESAAFENSKAIPAKYTCDGEDVNPPLVWSGAPENTKSFVLIMDDPDVPKNIRKDGLWVHWMLWNIVSEIQMIAENSLPNGAVQGITTFGRTGYGGPCPPDREHRYFFKLYALDTMLSLPSSATNDDLEQAMRGHILTQAELVGVYNRKR